MTSFHLVVDSYVPIDKHRFASAYGANSSSCCRRLLLRFWAIHRPTTTAARLETSCSSVSGPHPPIPVFLSWTSHNQTRASGPLKTIGCDFGHPARPNAHVLNPSAVEQLFGVSSTPYSRSPHEVDCP